MRSGELPGEYEFRCVPRLGVVTMKPAFSLWLPRMRRLLAGAVLLASPLCAWSQEVIATVAVGYPPRGIAINTVTDKIYVAASGKVTIIDGVTNSTTSVSLGGPSESVAVNESTNRIYATNGAGTVVIDGATNSTTTVIDPNASISAVVAVNAVTNKIYVGYLGVDVITVIDGRTNATTSIPITPGLFCQALAVNPVTNKIYALLTQPLHPLPYGNVTVIDGASNATTVLTYNPPPVGLIPVTPVDFAINTSTDVIYALDAASLAAIDGATNAVSPIAALPQPLTMDPGDRVGGGYALAVNSRTNQLYVPDLQDNNIAIIDGATNSVTTVSDPSVQGPNAVAVNETTNTIYVANVSGTRSGSNITVLDGSTHALNTIVDPNGHTPFEVAVNPVTNRIYAVNYDDGTVTVIDGNVAPLAVSSGGGGFDALTLGVILGFLLRRELAQRSLRA